MKISDALSVLENPVASSVITPALSAIAPPYGAAVAGAISALPVMSRSLERLLGENPPTEEERQQMRADWLKTRDEAVQVGKDWDASEANKQD